MSSNVGEFARSHTLSFSLRSAQVRTQVRHTHMLADLLVCFDTMVSALCPQLFLVAFIITMCAHRLGHFYHYRKTTVKAGMPWAKETVCGAGIVDYWYVHHRVVSVV